MPLPHSPFLCSRVFPSPLPLTHRYRTAAAPPIWNRTFTFLLRKPEEGFPLTLTLQRLIIWGHEVAQVALALRRLVSLQYLYYLFNVEKKE